MLTCISLIIRWSKDPWCNKNKLYSLNQNRFYRMNVCHLPYLSLFRGCIILRRVCFFLIFSLNYQQGVTVVFVLTNEKWLQNQFCKWIKSKLMDTFQSWKSSLFERVDLSIYCFLSSFSKSKSYDSPQTFVAAEAGFGLTQLVCLVFCLPDLDASMLVYKIKTNASHLYNS